MSNFAGTMTSSQQNILSKINDVIAELKNNALWKTVAPAWVKDYAATLQEQQQNFAEWLQFIYLPNYLQESGASKKYTIVPQAMKFFGEDVRRGKLLQLLIELDALL